ncbi:MAG: hypothetical protein AB7O78_03585 [Thermoleophilia bacterium]
MVEILVIAGLVAAVALMRESSRRRALRRARARAEGMLDDLANAACAAMAEPGRSGRRAERALERYGTARDRVAAASTRRELEWMVRKHEVRLAGYAFAARGLERVREMIAEAVPVRR